MFDAEVESQFNKISTTDKLTSEISRSSKQIIDIFEKFPDFTRVIILGSTGGGKSTFANSLIGRKIVVKKNKYDNIYLDCEEPVFEIGNQMISMTSIPNIYIDQIQHLIICDAAGFNDVRGPNQEIFNSFLIDQLFTSPCNIKLLFVLSEGDISIEGKGVKAMENLQRLSKILPDKKQLKQSIGLILSQINEEITPKQYLQQLKNGNPNEDIKKWAKFFISNYKSKLFCFPKAKSEQIDKYYIFKDRSPILEFLHSSPVHNPIHKVVLSESAKENIQKVSDHLGKFDNIVKNIILMLRTNYLNENITIEQLNELENSYNGIIKNCSQIKIPIDIIKVLQNNIHNLFQIEEYLNQIKCYNCMHIFKSHIENFVRSDKYIDFGENVRNLFEEEIKQFINEKRKFLIEKAKFDKSEKSKQLIQIQNDAIQKSHDTNKFKYDCLNSSYNSMQIQLEQERNNGNILSQKIEQLNEKILKQKEEEEKYGQEIKQLLDQIKENEIKSKKEIAALEKKLQEKIDYYESKLKDQTDEYQKESFLRCLGPFASFYYIGVSAIQLIKKVKSYFCP